MEKSETTKLTLCDGCILILLFGIAAFILTPRISQAVENNKLSSLVDRLHRIRSQINHYKVDHGGLLPGQQAVGDTVTSEAFTAALQDRDGKEPYLRNIPINPYISDPKRMRTVVCVNDPGAVPTGQENAAWWFNAATGGFFACDSKFHTNY